MEDTFRVRVDKTFGSLLPSSSSPPQPPPPQPPVTSSLWSLSDEEIPRNQWPRHSDDPASDTDDVEDEQFRSALKHGSLPSDVGDFLFRKPKLDSDDDENDPNPNPNNDMDITKQLGEDIEELDDDANDAGEELVAAADADELDVSNLIGLDPTVDFEEEEDGYDKVAVGKEKTDDCLYMRDVTDYVSHVDSCNELPTTFEEAARDPRADHLSAKLRLKEDAEAARSFNSLHVSDQHLRVVSTSDAAIDGENNMKSTLVRKEDQVEAVSSLPVSVESLPLVSGSESSSLDDGNNLKSILKRKEDQMDSKSGKRVRFDSSCKTNDGGDYEVEENVRLEACDEGLTLHGEATSQHQDSSLVPDYIRNPSKYTHYTFDSLNDMNEEANTEAYMEFLTMLKKSKQSEPEEIPADLSKRVMFNPKKKLGGGTSMAGSETDNSVEGPMRRKTFRISLAAENEQDDEGCEMEVDELSSGFFEVRNVIRTGRHYRSKPSAGEKESE